MSDAILHLEHLRHKVLDLLKDNYHELQDSIKHKHAIANEKRQIYITLVELFKKIQGMITTVMS